MNTTRLPSLFTPEPFVFDDAFRTFMRPFRWEPMAELPPIRLDISEVDSAYVVKADLPGLRKEDIHVEIDGAQVMISVQFDKETPTEKPAGRMLRSERISSYASRVFTLGFEIDRAKATAKYADGVLVLTLPKLVSAHVEPLVIE